MNNFISYLIEANICLLLFGLIYIIFFKNETDFKFRRYYILSAAIIAFTAPLLKLGSFYTTGSAELSGLPTLILPEITIGEKSANQTNIIFEYSTIWNAIKFIYPVIAVLLLQYFLFQIMQVFWFAYSNKQRIKKQNGILWVDTNGTLPTFSFFNLLFFDNSVKLNEIEKERIVNHELAHIQQKHSLDILLLEFIKILSWFNPISWLLRNEIQDLHEYLADQKAITNNNNPDDYSSLLVKMALNQANLNIGHHFNKSKTLKRIEMMKTIKEKVKNWKLALAIPMLISMAIIVSCNDEVINDVMQTSSQTEVPDNLKDKFNSLQKTYPEADFAYIETDGINKEALSNLQDMDPKSVAHLEVYKERGMVGVIFNKNGAFKTVEEKFTEGSTFTIVDEPSEPEGGKDAFYERLASNLEYPNQAKKLGIEGRVYVQFIVNTSGELEDLQVVKGIGAGCDLAAMEAIKNSGSWSIPKQYGKPVKQRIIVPIQFDLGDVENHNEE